jgi:hypothetical protein
MGVREAGLVDLPAVGDLLGSMGYPVPSHEEWSRLFLDNPAVKIDRPPLPLGWLLEVNNRPVGFIGNLTQLYSWQGAILRAAASTKLVVLPEYRGMTFQLLLPFVRQPHVDLLLNTTASPEASQVFQFLKFKRLPQADCDVSYIWVTQPAKFLSAALWKKGLSPPWCRIGGVAAAPALRFENWLRGRRLRATGNVPVRVDVVRAKEIGSEFDHFWAAKRAEDKRMLAVRSSETLRNCFHGDGGAQFARFIRAWNGSRLVGYAALVPGHSSWIALIRLKVADLLAERDDPLIVQELLAAAFTEARRAQVHMLEVIGCPAHIRQMFETNRPYRLKDKAHTYLYQARDPVLRAALESPDAWYPTLIDGDGLLID